MHTLDFSPSSGVEYTSADMHLCLLNFGFLFFTVKCPRTFRYISPAALNSQQCDTLCKNISANYTQFTPTSVVEINCLNSDGTPSTVNPRETYFWVGILSILNGGTTTYQSAITGKVMEKPNITIVPLTSGVQPGIPTCFYLKWATQFEQVLYQQVCESTGECVCHPDTGKKKNFCASIFAPHTAVSTFLCEKF